MSSITDLYNNLFGRKGIADGNVIDMAEHGRVGGLSTGQPFKFVTAIDGAEPTAGNNPETILSFNAAKQLIYIDEVIAGTTYRQTVEGTGAKLIDDYVVASTQTFGSAVKV